MRSKNIVFFNWETLVKKARSMPDIIKALEIHYYKRLLPNLKEKDKYLYNVSYAGNSWILNPEVFFNIKSHIRDKVFALYLASKRDYTKYKLYGDRGLPLSYVEEYLPFVKTNKLIRIENNIIYFTFEENNGT